MTETEYNEFKSQLDTKFDTNFTLERLGISTADFIQDAKDQLMQNITDTAARTFDNADNK